MLASSRWCVCLLGTVVVGMCGCSGHVTTEGVLSVVTDAGGPHAGLGTSTATSEMHTLSLHEVPEVFKDLAASMVGVPIFGVRSLPQGVAVEQKWWPVIEGPDEIVEKLSGDNPRVVGIGEKEAEGQIVLSSGTGWLVILENFGGDLGDVTGEAAGTVAGQSALLYEVNGGWLVQWEFEGRWYGVFGRDVDAETVRTLALDMALLKGD